MRPDDDHAADDSLNQQDELLRLLQSADATPESSEELRETMRDLTRMSFAFASSNKYSAWKTADERNQRRSFLRQAMAIAAGTAAVATAGGFATGQRVSASERQRLKDALGSAERSRAEAEAALRQFIDEGYLSPVRFTGLSGAGGILIDGNSTLLCTGIIAPKRVAKLLVYLSNRSDPIEIPASEMSTTPRFEGWMSFAKRLPIALDGHPFEARLVAKLTDETKTLRERVDLADPDQLEIKRSFIATTSGLVVSPEHNLPLLGLRSIEEVISLSPAFNVTPIRDGNLCVFLVTLSGDRYLVSTPQHINAAVPLALKLRLPRRVSAGDHKLVFGLAPSPHSWPTELREGDLPLEVKNLPADANAIQYSEVGIRLDGPERRLARWVLQQHGTVEVYSVDDRHLEVRRLDQLPPNQFEVLNIDLTGCELPSIDLEANLIGADPILLRLTHTDIDDQGFAKIAKSFRRLRWIQLNNTKIGDDAVGQLATLPSLSLLGLKSTRVTDVAIEALSHVTTVRELHLELTAVTDASIELFEQSFKELNELRLAGSKVTPTAIERLRKSRPDINVRY